MATTIGSTPGKSHGLAAPGSVRAPSPEMALPCSRDFVVNTLRRFRK
jgi:hypothetical protein